MLNIETELQLLFLAMKCDSPEPTKNERSEKIPALIVNYFLRHNVYVKKNK